MKMTLIKTPSANEFAKHLNLWISENESEVPSIPAAWGVARLIRREIRRRGLATRRELRQAVEPFLIAAGFEQEPGLIIRAIADRMVEAGEVADIRLDHQRGYAAVRPAWVKFSPQHAVLLGVADCDLEFTPPSNANQFLRRFCPSHTVISELARNGFRELTFTEWRGDPAWQSMPQLTQPFNSMQDFLAFHVDLLNASGVAFSRTDTRVLVVDHKPGDFFGTPMSPSASRWKSPGLVADGIYCGVQPDDRNSSLWHPLLVELQGNDARSILLNNQNDHQATLDLAKWLLIALSASLKRPEQVHVDPAKSTLQITFHAPNQLRRCLNLAGDYTHGWTYSISDWLEVAELFPEIDFTESKHRSK